MLNGAIATLRAEHQHQIDAMKEFYMEQISLVREEFTQKEKVVR